MGKNALAILRHQYKKSLSCCCSPINIEQHCIVMVAILHILPFSEEIMLILGERKKSTPYWLIYKKTETEHKQVNEYNRKWMNNRSLANAACTVHLSHKELSMIIYASCSPEEKRNSPTRRGYVKTDKSLSIHCHRWICHSSCFFVCSCQHLSQCSLRRLHCQRRQAVMKWGWEKLPMDLLHWIY